MSNQVSILSPAPACVTVLGTLKRSVRNRVPLRQRSSFEDMEPVHDRTLKIGKKRKVLRTGRLQRVPEKNKGEPLSPSKATANTSPTES